MSCISYFFLIHQPCSMCFIPFLGVPFLTFQDEKPFIHYFVKMVHPSLIQHRCIFNHMGIHFLLLSDKSVISKERVTKQYIYCDGKWLT